MVSAGVFGCGFGAADEASMGAYILSAILVALGGFALLADIILGASANANYLIEGAFALFGLAAIAFVLSVILGLAKEFREIS